jgi:hypothetical protein
LKEEYPHFNFRSKHYVKFRMPAGLYFAMLLEVIKQLDLFTDHILIGSLLALNGTAKDTYR